MNKIIISNKLTALIILNLALLICGQHLDVSAQVKAGEVKKRKNMGVEAATTGTTKKVIVPEFQISGTVTSPDGNPVGNALITSNEGAIVLRSDKNGQFKTKARMGSSVLVEATGFEPLVYEIKQEENNLKLVLENVLLYTGRYDAVNLPLGVKEKQRYLVGAVSGVSGDALQHFPEPLLSNTLQGQIAGLYAQMTTNGLASNPANLFIRGQHRNGGNDIVILIDGVERDINSLLLDEVESVKIMKDATSKILYGSRAANGVLSVTTKHGKEFTRKINITAETGYGLPVAYPTYLNSYDYATLYNEARMNDGLPPKYSTADLQGYRNSSGPNDLRYPNVDYLNYFLSKTTGYHKISLEFSGGNENAQYSLVAGYNGNSGLQDVGTTPTKDMYNVRANLDMKITDHLKAFVGMAGVFDVTSRSSLSDAETFARISSTRPNEFPLVIDQSHIPLDTLGYPGLGASYVRNNNLYGALMYGGKYSENSVNGQLTLGLLLDLSQFVKGLSMKGQLAFDKYFTGQESISVGVATYAQRWSYDPALGKDTVTFQKLSNTLPSDQNKLTNELSLSTTSYLVGLDYERTFNQEHRISANLFTHYMMREETGTTPNLQTANTALRANYSFKDKYVAEMDMALMGSDKFTKNNRYFMSYAGGLGWILSEEDFLKGNNSINYLKLKISGGLLGYDAQTDWNLYDTRWQDNGSYNVRQNVGFNRVALVNVGNPNLKWERDLEFNYGLEGLLLNRKVWMEVNYFNETRSDIIKNPGSSYSAIYGNLYGEMNMEKVSNHGIDFELKYMNKSGNLFYSVGLTGTYSENKLLATNEIEDPMVYRRTVGKPTDAMFGYVAGGLFGKDVDLSGAPNQTLGYYSIGDIAYKDINGDSIINAADQKMLGNSFPRIDLGLNVDLAWKGFALNLVGVSTLGVHSWLNNSYYWNYGENKWSDQTLARYNPVTNPEGTYPRLTTTNGANNFVNSTFWLANTSFFRLKNAELSYTFGYDKPLTASVKAIKVFLRGSNILTLSKVKNLDPEVLDAGVSTYPVLSVYTVGLNFVF